MLRCKKDHTPERTVWISDKLTKLKDRHIFFFLVLCLPRQVRTSNGVIHHDVQISPSTCCNPQDFIIQSSNIILGLPLFFFTSILLLTIVLRRESYLIMWPSHCLFRLQIIAISNPFSSTILN